MWQKIDSKTPIDTAIITCIKDENGMRNVQKLIFDGLLWFNEDKTMYVYYTPTHYML